MLDIRGLLLAVLAGVVMLVMPLAAQESEQSDNEQVSVETDETETEDDIPEDDAVIDEAGLDEQGFDQDDDDDFIPSEEIGADQSIPFPTDI